MSQSQRSTRARSGRFVPSIAVNKVHDITLSLDPSGLSKPERKKLSASSRRVPDALIDRVATLATQAGGKVLGFEFDVEAARQTLAYASECRGVVDAADELARRIDDDVLQHRSVVAERAFALYKALGNLVRTPEGKPFEAAYAQMQAIVRAHRPPRARKSKSAEPATQAPPTVSTPTPPAQPVASR